jgi:predicted nucleic acid-binding protein
VRACEIVWTEIGTVFSNQKSFLNAMNTLGIEFSSIELESALFAAHAWQLHRKPGGKRDRVVADFLIAAHAKHQGNRLLTRDRGFYRKYFKTLTILDPAN